MHWLGKLFLAATLAVDLAACAESRPSAPQLPPQGGIPAGAFRPASFLYQLQGIDLEAIARSGYELAVIDPSADGSDAAAFSAAQIEALRRAPRGPKVVLAYLSLGEAESYRSYWRAGWDADADGRPDASAPGWLGAENPEWQGNYAVRYWDPGWKALVYGSSTSALDRILSAGFDGVYLDRVDAYAEYEAAGRAAAAGEMAALVGEVAEYARRHHPGFLIVPQNAAELEARVPGYLEQVDGIGQEDLYYGYPDQGDASPRGFVIEVEGHLDHFVRAGKLVLVIGYTTDPAQIDDQYRRAHARGYLPFATVRALDRLTVNPGHAP